MNKWSRPLEWNRAPAEPAGPGEPRPRRHRNQYFAFLSYSHEDAQEADWLHKQLERFRVPGSLAGRLTAHGVVPSRLTPIFRDRHELAAGDDLNDEIREALASSHCLIVLCSPAAARSRWTNAEIETFKKLHPDGCVIAAIVAGEPFASETKGREGDECLPPALRQKYDRRGRPTGRRAEPLAADLRDAGDGRRLGFLKVVAGLLGVGLDDLVQRDQLRRQRRLAWITAASFAGMIVALVLAVTAIEARDEARDQRREAEGLVAFMLGDLKEKLEPIGELDALDGVGARVLEYYRNQDTSELSDEALLQRSRALSLTAQVASSRGDTATAEQLYRQAMAGTEEAVRRDPDDAERIFDHAQNVFWIGELARRRGDVARAETAYREYKRLGDRLVELDPDNLRWRMEPAYGEVNLGIVMRSQRRFPEAARQFASALATVEGVASIDRSNREYQEELANLLGWLADAERDQGNLAKAIAVRERQVAFLRGLLSEGDDVRFRVRLVPALQGLGLLRSWTAGPTAAIDQLQEAVTEADRLVRIEPDNSYWKALGSQARLDLAANLLAVGQRGYAAAQARDGCAAAVQVLARDQAPTWRHLRTNCLTLRARLALSPGNEAEAASLAEQAVASARTHRGEDPTRDRYAVAAALRLLGDVHQRSGKYNAALSAWSSALALLPSGVAERPLEMGERAELLRRLGRGQEAGSLKGRLQAIGLRHYA